MNINIRPSLKTSDVKTDRYTGGPVKTHSVFTQLNSKWEFKTFLLKMLKQHQNRFGKQIL